VLSFGVDSPISAESPVARTRIVNAVYQLSLPPALGFAKDRGDHDLRASYRCRAGTHSSRAIGLCAPFRPRTHYRFAVDIRICRGFLAGVISGAPLFERSCWHAETAARWNKFDLDPWARRISRTGLSTTFIAASWCFTIQGGLGSAGSA